MLNFKFMVHDKWANVLFLHWRVPPRLEPALEADCGNFVLDRTPDGAAWIGLILLTEHNVGPPCLRSSLTCVTHHGVNVRTYVQGAAEGRPDDGDERARARTRVKRGIHFSSLECDDRFTSFGANIFGMPYKVASMDRRYGLEKEWAAETEDEQMQRLLSSPGDSDDFVCVDGSGIRRMKTFRLSSVRSRRSFSLVDLLRPVSAAYRCTSLHGTQIRLVDDTEKESGQGGGATWYPSRTGISDTTFYSVHCEWERCSEVKLRKSEAELAEFFVERYYVYTHKYGMNWRGEVEHDPWPVEKALLKRLDITNIQNYEPKLMQPLIDYMSCTEPDSVLFSPGVGPIAFNMLKPTSRHPSDESMNY